MKQLTQIDTTKPIVNADGTMTDRFRFFMVIVFNLLKNKDEENLTLADDTETPLVDASAGYGFCQIGDNQEYASFTWESDGTVTLLTDISANVANSDTDGNLCIYNSGTQVYIKNRLGLSLNLRYSVNYNPQ